MSERRRWTTVAWEDLATLVADSPAEDDTPAEPEPDDDGDVSQ